MLKKNYEGGQYIDIEPVQTLLDMSKLVSDLLQTSFSHFKIFEKRFFVLIQILKNRATEGLRGSELVDFFPN